LFARFFCEDSEGSTDTIVWLGSWKTVEALCEIHGFTHDCPLRVALSFNAIDELDAIRKANSKRILRTKLALKVMQPAQQEAHHQNGRYSAILLRVRQNEHDFVSDRFVHECAVTNRFIGDTRKKWFQIFADFCRSKTRYSCRESNEVDKADVAFDFFPTVSGRKRFTISLNSSARVE